MGFDKRKRGSSVLDVARLCGVSPSTVCRVINGRSNVSEAAKARVLEACASLGFKKNAAASLLRLRKSNAVACLMPDQSHEMFIDKMESLKRATLALGRSWRLHSFHDEGEARHLLDEIVAGRPAAAILGCKLNEEERLLLDSNDVAVLCYDLEDPFYDSVAIDREAGVFDAVSHLLSKGRCKLLALGFSPGSERGEGSLRAYAAAGLPADAISFLELFQQRDPFRAGYESIVRALDSGLRFDSLMAVNDASAIGAMRLFSERGLRVPEDVSVVGFDDIMVSSFTKPALSTVSQPKDLMASKTMEFLTQRLADSSLPRQFARIRTVFTRRESA